MTGFSVSLALRVCSLSGISLSPLRCVLPSLAVPPVLPRFLGRARRIVAHVVPRPLATKLSQAGAHLNAPNVPPVMSDERLALLGFDREGEVVQVQQAGHRAAAVHD